MSRKHTLSLVTLLAMALVARNASADGAAPAPDGQDDGPTIARPIPPPVPPPPDADDGGDTVLQNHLTHGGYGAPSLKITSLAGDPTLLAGAEGGWIIGHAIVLGGAGYTTVTDVVSPAVLQPASGNARLGLGYGGFRFGAIFRHRRVAHLTMGLLVGGGGADSETKDGSYHRSDRFFVVEPDLTGEVNVARHVRFALGGTYRFVGGTEVAGFTATRLSGPAALFSLRFGEF